ncbi:MAG: lytic transglycosylase domain-containing protein [Bacteroidota bacterium]|nr:lytic transglycosylase domain-containing protein [Bacteroidota bacterium]MDP4234207.1 lytic transglycosylase domain-containing protein [Bacteroidota bacterium]MDP4244133.1 lytic transglycosylase domain-containing protein [Bacteroidota bacterium]MDP4288096.1 lytic transglycosylase domain-containing protein [Bacteroidota bacterium]
MKLTMFELVTRSIRNLALGVVVSVGVLLALMVVDRWSAGHNALEISRTQAAPPFGEPGYAPGPFAGGRSITDLELPKEVSIFGERVPLENWEMRERFEREFYYNWNNASALVIWWNRSGRYFPMIHKMLEDAGLPTDLQYLAVAESGLANIKSPANANGFWQFIPGTAQRFGLRVDDLIDERLDPEKATRAAIAYFKYMKSMFSTWTLVAAGYNMGEDNVATAMQWQHAESYWNLNLNDETMRYVFRIAALKELMTHGDKYGLDFGHLKPYHTPAVKYASVTGPIASISDWAFGMGYLYKDVKVLNPWLAGRSIPSGTWQIALPLTEADRPVIR